jgi:hypothetical protein
MKTWLPALAGFCACALIVVASASVTPAGSIADSDNSNTDSVIFHKDGQPYFPAVKIPETLEFAGEEVPLEDFEVKERLDRELLVNSYWHSQTIQNIKLANRWFPIFEEILSKNGLPEDFKYLAVAESNLRNVVSPAGASGFWQIMKSTGQSYGLKVNSEVDERYHQEKATEAACKYLLEAKERFGDWTLAAASYNMGMPGLDSRLGKQKVDSYYDLYLNRETSRYVFRILAFKLIYQNYEQFGFILDEEDLYDPLDYYTIKADQPITNLADFASEQGTTYKMLKVLNPWLRSNRLSASSSSVYELKLPRN